MQYLIKQPRTEKASEVNLTFNTLPASDELTRDPEAYADATDELTRDPDSFCFVISGVWVKHLLAWQ